MIVEDFQPWVKKHRRLAHRLDFLRIKNDGSRTHFSPYRYLSLSAQQLLHKEREVMRISAKKETN
jgi:hypothetical protein